MISKTNKDLKKAISEKLNLSNLGEEKQEKIIAKILENVSLKASILLLDRLTEKEREEFAKLKAQKEVMDFLNKKTIDIYLLVDEAVSMIVSDLKKIKKKL